MLPEIYPAKIELDVNGLPFATDYGDRYFSRESGLDETRHVFLQGNQLPEAWQGKDQFIIAETGFGTGLNFLATWQTWQNDPKHCTSLHYISFEKHPIPKAQLAELLATWPELDKLTQELLLQYPPVLAGFHQLKFANHQVNLTLCFADAESALKDLVAKVDAWYLDGFAPTKNAELWSAPLFQAIAAHSKPHSTLATFTVAGQVRRNLQAAGFTWEKRTGFGQKREMLTARLTGISATHLEAAWFSLPAPQFKERTATIIGAGVAGCQIAYALALRGWQVQLLEQQREIAQEASGNRAGVLTPKMTAEPDWGERFYRQAFLYAARQLQSLIQEPANKELEWFASGSLQLKHNASETKRCQALEERGLPSDFIQLLDATEASSLAGIQLAMGGSYFPKAGYLYPRSLCKALTQHPLIKLQTQTEALHLIQTAQETWQVLNAANELIAESAVVVLANGKDVAQFTQSNFLPFLPVRGQTTQAVANVYTSQLQLSLGHEGYLTPAIAGQHIFGASFERGEALASIKSSDDELNYQQLAHYLPEFAANLGTKASSHAAIRMTTPDRYPYVGPLPDPDLFRQTYAGIQHGAKYKTWPQARYQTGLFISAGYGSRGLTTTPLCSELLAALITGEPLPLELSLYYKLHPARFLLKKLQQQRD
ncbi:bifunctional tRNA (5-methylaminomethyl-2-thiouridine)(34)-methyltransferase MnmD/FAD-dependent 5-carboxymethylaminomethyl-2-thiouridine(34) oxidoreductase MnmC [uncultured Thiothrix sp.]|uniref:bifunctional tRNA (5-methylaminomethyl-2-thiouridine)(34)-methyltransferase MnmD/FAD-dependent 5-carboxymethylaminomethyl-2-thiouridine(34) oxidoreductase MnmC n=1 Tax=uncultured Thiothrix sp. TaxID=223185 RepID=UPI0026322C02|nr:bifunctional tRNA (5-methylaminomethyl-2-thiouridine)(34)-methyltransferase MnmD/FAD-dependent 5-carboxymethylaminomethyl-2-thiouridine(34) oxidoreductase MnmC [uncultured Thiothrix sp.]